MNVKNFIKGKAKIVSMKQDIKDVLKNMYKIEVYGTSDKDDDEKYLDAVILRNLFKQELDSDDEQFSIEFYGDAKQELKILKKYGLTVENYRVQEPYYLVPDVDSKKGEYFVIRPSNKNYAEAKTRKNAKKVSKVYIHIPYKDIKTSFWTALRLEAQAKLLKGSTKQIYQEMLSNLKERS